MTKQNAAPSPLEKVWSFLGTFTARWNAMTTFQNARLKSIEDRLAALDGGDNAEAAQRSAIRAADDRKIANGQGPLGMRLAGHGDDLTVEWIGPETTGQPQ